MSDEIFNLIKQLHISMPDVYDHLMDAGEARLEGKITEKEYLNRLKNVGREIANNHVEQLMAAVQKNNGV